MPDPATEQGRYIFDLWNWAWVAALVDRRHRLGPDLLGRGPLPPPQRRRDPGADALQPAARDLLHDRPGHHGASCSSTTPSTPRTSVLDDRRRARPHRRGRRPAVVLDVQLRRRGRDVDGARDVYDAPAPAADIPTLVLPVDQTIQFDLHSPDVIHSFGVPGFLMKMDVIPGRVNHFAGHARHVEGTFAGKCYELCGVYHSRMLFNVEVVSQAEYEAYLAGPRGRRATRPTSRCSVASDAYTQAGLDDEPTRRRRRGVTATAAAPARPSTGRKPLGQQVVRILTTTDHKLIGKLYLVTSFAWFLVGGLMAHADPLRAGLPRAAGRQRRALQPAVHDARHDHAAAVRDAAVLRLRQRDHAAADRLARRRVPAAEHVQLLAVPVRRPHRRLRLPHPAGRRRLRLVRLHAAVRRRPLAGRRR